MARTDPISVLKNFSIVVLAVFVFWPLFQNKKYTKEVNNKTKEEGTYEKEEVPPNIPSRTLSKKENRQRWVCRRLWEYNTDKHGGHPIPNVSWGGLKNRKDFVSETNNPWTTHLCDAWYTQDPQFFQEYYDGGGV